MMEIVIEDEYPELLCLSKHHLKSIYCDAITIHGNKYISSLYRSYNKYEGVCFFVKNVITTFPVDVLKYC